MEFKELAFNRRSVRKFLDRKVEKEVIDRILDITFTSPSSKNLRTTRIAVVEDRELLEGIVGMRSSGTSFVKDAPMAFVVMGDAEATDMWDVNCCISATVLQFAAESQGLGSCWVQVKGRPNHEDHPEGKTAEEYLYELMPQLKPYRIMCVVAAGYPESRPKPHTVKDDSDKVMYL